MTGAGAGAGAAGAGAGGRKAGGGGPGGPGARPWTEARLIAVGDELLLGRTADTNSQELARALTARGLTVAGVAVTPDDRAAIAAALDAAPPGSLVIVGGGLGPTDDDLTREAVAAWGGAALETRPDLEAYLRARCAARGVPYGAGTARQAAAPSGFAWLANPVGSAPGLLGELRGRTVALLPGVPAELRGLLPALLAALEAAGRLPAPRPAVLLRTAQIGESSLAERCSGQRAAHPGLAWSWWLATWGVDVRISLPPGRDAEPDRRALAAAAAGLRGELGLAVYAEDARELPEVVQRAMVERGLTLSVAESCTGGLLGGRLTEQPGASAWFRGGVIAYADEVKTAALDVPPGLLAAHGAVSGECAAAMAAGCRRRFATDYALAITGIAGPDGGSDDKPVGTTWVAIAGPGGVRTRAYRFPADRGRNRQLAATAALDTLRRQLALGDAAEPWLASDTWRAR